MCVDDQDDSDDDDLKEYTQVVHPNGVDAESEENLPVALRRLLKQLAATRWLTRERLAY